ncbi:MAG: hypothetical protein H6642_05975 [Caldilineaceae bacterium]|nr:hypothetical protein [Caldilineaceae bacterium]
MHVGKAIFAALAHQEISDLLNNLFKALPSDLHQQILDQLSADTRHTLEQILASPNAVDGIGIYVICTRAQVSTKVRLHESCPLDGSTTGDQCRGVSSAAERVTC